MVFFKKETELVKELSKHVKKIYSQQNGIIIISQEESAGLGIFDYAIFDINKKSFLKRVRAGLGTPLTSESMVSVMLHLKIRQPRTINYLQKETGINVNHLKTKVLKFLLKKRYVVKNKNGSLCKHPSYENFITYCVAIEAKLEKWKEALLQAYRYKGFANRSYVALSSKYIKTAAKNIKEFKKMNIGLIEVDKKKGIKIVFKPKSEKPKSKIAAQLCNEIVIKNYYRRFRS